jgi:hypothetical protein
MTEALELYLSDGSGGDCVAFGLDNPPMKQNESLICCEHFGVRLSSRIMLFAFNKTTENHVVPPVSLGLMVFALAFIFRNGINIK